MGYWYSAAWLSGSLRSYRCGMGSEREVPRDKRECMEAYGRIYGNRALMTADWRLARERIRNLGLPRARAGEAYPGSV